jgi:hypothetical protein
VGSSVSAFVWNCKVLKDGYVTGVVYKIVVTVVIGYVQEEFGVLFMFVCVMCQTGYDNSVSVKFCHLYGGPTILQLLLPIDGHILYFSTSRSKLNPS